jgi:hypothetical protein
MSRCISTERSTDVRMTSSPCDPAFWYHGFRSTRANENSASGIVKYTGEALPCSVSRCCVARPEAVLVADRLAVPGEPWSGAEAGRRVGLARVRRRRCQRRSSRVTLCRSRPRARGSAASAAEPRIRTARRRGPGPAERDGLQGHGSTGSAGAGSARRSP